MAAVAVVLDLQIIQVVLMDQQVDLVEVDQLMMVVESKELVVREIHHQHLHHKAIMVEQVCQTIGQVAVVAVLAQ
jgi:hypothetical protein